jgi:hypothetical protein
MAFEQPAAFNRYLAAPMPLTWASRWKYIQFALPLVFFCAMCLLERVGIMMWMMGKFKSSILLLVLLFPGFLLAVLSILGEIKLRGAQQDAPRLLNLLDKGVSFYSSKRPQIRWPNIVAFWFEDIPGEPNLRKVTIEWFRKRKTKFLRRDELVLEKRGQCPALLSELKLLQQQHNLTFRIELDQPLPPPKTPRHPVLGLSLFFAGLLFLLHGMPLLMGSLTHRDGGSHQSESNEYWSPEQKVKFENFLKAHFPGKSEFIHFTFATGCALTAIGTGLIIWGNAVGQQTTEDKQPAAQRG